MLDRDGDPDSKDDQSVIAEVNQQHFADGTKPAAEMPLWSGAYNAGVFDLTPAATVIVRRKSSGKAITTDLLLLEPVGSEAVSYTHLTLPTNREV